MSDFAKRMQRQSDATRTGGGSYWKPNDGENRIRLLPFRHVMTDGDEKLGRVDAGFGQTVGESIEELFCVYMKHMKPEAQVCGRVRRLDGKVVGDCELCERAERMQASPDKADQDLGKRYRAGAKFAVNIVDMNDPSRRVQIWDLPTSIHMELTKKLKMSIYEGVEIAGTKGRDLIITYDAKNKDPKAVYGVVIVEAQQTRPLSQAELKGAAQDLYLKQNFVPVWAQPYLTPATTAPKAAPKPVEPPPSATASASPEVAAPAPAKRSRKKSEPPAAPAQPDWKGKTVRFRLDEADPNSEVITGVVAEKTDQTDVWLVSVEGSDPYEVATREFLQD